MTLTDRILAVLDTLGIRTAHWATQSPGDIAALVESHPERIAGVALTAPSRIDPHPFAPLAERLLYVSPAGGMLGTTAARALPRSAITRMPPEIATIASICTPVKLTPRNRIETAETISGAVPRASG